jgi:hypothetical protein
MGQGSLRPGGGSPCIARATRYHAVIRKDPVKLRMAIPAADPPGNTQLA